MVYLSPNPSAANVKPVPIKLFFSWALTCSHVEYNQSCMTNSITSAITRPYRRGKTLELVYHTFLPPPTCIRWPLKQLQLPDHWQTDRWDTALGVCRRLNERNAWGTRRNEGWLREQSSDSGGKHWLTLDKSLSIRISARPLAKSSSHVVLHPVCIPQMCSVAVSGASPSAY